MGAEVAGDLFEAGVPPLLPSFWRPSEAEVEEARHARACLAEVEALCHVVARLTPGNPEMSLGDLVRSLLWSTWKARLRILS